MVQIQHPLAYTVGRKTEQRGVKCPRLQPRKGRECKGPKLYIFNLLEKTMEREIWEKSEEVHNNLLDELNKEWDELKEHMIPICYYVFNMHGDPQRANEAEVIKSFLGERFYELCVATGLAGQVMNKIDEIGD